jgi:hypothetical protein
MAFLFLPSFSFIFFLSLALQTLGVITPTTGASLELFEVAYLKRPGFRMSQLSLTHMGRLRGPRVFTDVDSH